MPVALLHPGDRRLAYPAVRVVHHDHRSKHKRDTHPPPGTNPATPVGAIAMGVPYYGYEWPTRSLAAGATTTGAGTSVLFDSVFTKFATYGRIWDTASQTPWYAYAAAGQPRQGWVEDGESLARKYRFARTRDLAGVMIWALGYDGARTEAWN